MIYFDSVVNMAKSPQDGRAKFKGIVIINSTFKLKGIIVIINSTFKLKGIVIINSTFKLKEIVIINWVLSQLTTRQ